MGQQVRHLLEKRESTSDNHASARQRVEWPRADLFGYIIQVESGVTGTAVWWKTTFTFGSESTFFVENSSFPFVWIPQRWIKNLWALSIPSLEPRRKTPSPSDSISLLTLYMWAPDIYEGSPTPVTAFLSIAPKISISANISRVSIYGSYGATLQQIFFFCSIASMILGALPRPTQIVLPHDSGSRFRGWIRLVISLPPLQQVFAPPYAYNIGGCLLSSGASKNMTGDSSLLSSLRSLSKFLIV